MTITCGPIALTIEHPATVHWSRMAGKLACWGLEYGSRDGRLFLVLASDGSSHRWTYLSKRAEMDDAQESLPELLTGHGQWLDYVSDRLGSPLGVIRRRS